MKRRRIVLMTTVVCVLISFACRPSPTPVDNLVAFAKLYGYVRFFHPSDAAAEADWERLAVYGVRAVRDAGSRDELRQTLEDLFLPLAPTLQIYDTAEGPPDPLDVLTPPDSASLDLVAWQHAGVDLGLDMAAEAHRSVRLHRTPASTASPSHATFWQKLDARPYRGQEIELEAAVRTDGTNRAALAVYAELPDQQPGFSNFMVDRPITSETWGTYRVSGVVDATADSIGVGGSFEGAGTVWFDEFRLRVRRNGTWTPIPLEDAEFETVADGWTTFGEGYSFTPTSDDAYSGDGSFRASFEADAAAAKLFERAPSPGEVVQRALGSGLSVQLPLALYSRDGRTIRPAQAPAPDSLDQALAGISPAASGWSDEAVRLADVIVTWNVLQHFFPYFDEVEVDWEAMLPTTLEAALSDEDPDAFFTTFREMIAPLRDGHAYVSDPFAPDYASLPVFPVVAEGRVIAASVPPAGSPFEAGDEILTVDGEPALAYLDAHARLHSGSDQLTRLSALRRFGWGPRGEIVPVTIERGGQEIELNVPRTHTGFYSVERPPVVTELVPGIAYVDPSRLAQENIADALGAMMTADAVILDYRSRPRVNLVGHFTERPLRSPTWDIPQIIYPDQEAMTFDTTNSWSVAPREPHVPAPVAFLMDAGSISATESMLQIVDHYHVGVLIGRPSAGANGDLNRIPLPSGGYVQFAGRRVRNIDGSRLHAVGIRPDVRVDPSVESLREGRDEILDAAVYYLQSELQE